MKIYERHKIQKFDDDDYDWITDDCKIFRSKYGTMTSDKQELYGKLVIETVEIIDIKEFINSKSVEIIKFPTSLLTIEKYAFEKCENLTSLDFSNCRSLTTIEYDAFGLCSILASLDFSNCTSLATIGENAFYNCRNLQKCRLPKKLETIYGNSFGNYKSLYFYTDIDKNSDAYKTLLTICGSDDNRIRPLININT